MRECNKERSFKIKQLRESGLTYREIGKIVNLSGARVGGILHELDRRNCLDANDLERILEYNCRAINVVRRKYGYISVKELCDIVLKDDGYCELLKIRNCGEKAATHIMQCLKKYKNESEDK